MSTVGSFLLPDAIVRLNDARLRAETDVLRENNTRMELEGVLRNTVLLHGSTVREREKVRQACIQLLDVHKQRIIFSVSVTRASYLTYPKKGRINSQGGGPAKVVLPHVCTRSKWTLSALVGVFTAR